MKKNFTASILHTIHAKKITPHERYYFIAQTVLRIVSGIAFLAFGMLSVALVWHLIHNFAFAEFVLERPSILAKLFWFGVPLFWVILSVALWVVTEQIIKRTDRVYRVPSWGVGAVVLLLQIFGGFVLEQSSVGERLDLLFEQRMELYHGAQRINHRFERMPEAGFLAGKIMKLEPNKMLLLNDRIGKMWNVSVPSLTNGRIVLREGMIIRLFGKMISDNEFKTVLWRPEMPPRMMDRRGF
jgi:uncharacterized membrane protein YidH (DUF202 family)